MFRCASPFSPRKKNIRKTNGAFRKHLRSSTTALLLSDSAPFRCRPNRPGSTVRVFRRRKSPFPHRGRSPRCSSPALRDGCSNSQDSLRVRTRREEARKLSPGAGIFHERQDSKDAVCRTRPAGLHTPQDGVKAALPDTERPSPDLRVRAQ